VDGLTGCERIRCLERPHVGDRPEVDVVSDRHGLALGVHDADLIAEMQVDRCRPHLVREERLDHHSPRLDLSPDHIARQDHPVTSSDLSIVVTRR